MAPRWRDYLFRTIRVRLMAFIFAMALVLLLFLGFMLFRVSSGIIEKSVTQNTSELMDQVLDNIEFHLKDMESVSTDMIFNQTIIHNLRKINGKYDTQDIQATNEIKAALTSQLSLKKGLKSVFLLGNDYFFISSDNTYVSPAPIEYVPEEMKREEWYGKTVRKGGSSFFTIVGGGSDSRDDGDETEVSNRRVRLTRLFRDIQSGNPLGVLAVDLDYRVIDGILSKLHTEYNGSLMLVDEDGRTLFKRDRENRFANEERKETAGPPAAGESGIDEISLHGEKLLRIYRTSPMSGWRVIELIPSSKVLSPVRFIQKLTLILLAACLLAALIMAGFVTNRVLKPLHQLVGLMKKVQLGDLDVKLDLIRHDEIGHLSRNFNVMMLRLKEMRSEMYKEQELKRQAELSALQAQIQPHFLYNTLDSIKWMAVIRGEQQISDMIYALVNLLRSSISLGKETIPIRREIDNLQHYIKLQQLRYLHAFEMEIQADEAALNCGIPKLILQPLVENALYHGFESTADGGLIRLIVRRQDGYIHFSVTDNGKGMTQEQLAGIMDNRGKSRFTGISVKNVHERLMLHYGIPYGLTFASAEGSGTEVSFRIPARPVEEDEHAAQSAAGG